jgi:hypothetical protein
MSKHISISLTPEQRQHLDSLIRKGNAPARVQTRARILLLADRSTGHKRAQKEVAEAVLTHPVTVGRLCRTFLEQGLEATLHDKPRPGAVPKITGDVEAKLITLACSDPPDGRSRWTLRLLADTMVQLGYVDSITNVAVYNRLKKTRLSLGI